MPIFFLLLLAVWVRMVVQQRCQRRQRGSIAESADLDDSCGAMIVVGTIEPVPRPQDGSVADPLLYINGAIETVSGSEFETADRTALRDTGKPGLIGRKEELAVYAPPRGTDTV